VLIRAHLWFQLCFWVQGRPTGGSGGGGRRRERRPFVSKMQRGLRRSRLAFTGRQGFSRTFNSTPRGPEFIKIAENFLDGKATASSTNACRLLRFCIGRPCRNRMPPSPRPHSNSSQYWDRLNLIYFNINPIEPNLRSAKNISLCGSRF